MILVDVVIKPGALGSHATKLHVYKLHVYPRAFYV